ncbi:MAG: hemerythrin domain-containing protein [Hyphomicrobiales bacterium]
MQATTILKEEHRVIERVLDALETAALRLEAGEPVPLDVFARGADFIKGFADGCHHRKEEGILFPALERAGIPRDAGPIGVMLREHEEGRDFTAAMRDAAERLAAGDEDAREDLVGSALGYVALLRAHIAKEDNVLFPMADQVLRGPAESEVAAEFDRVEREETGEGVHRHYLDLAAAIETLASRR